MTDADIAAILLVVCSNSGHHLVFRHPPPEDRGSWSELRLLSHTHQLLARLLTPQPQLCEQRFQLSIDQTTFIGLPSLFLPERNPKTRPMLRRRSSAESPDPSLLKETVSVLATTAPSNEHFWRFPKFAGEFINKSPSPSPQDPTADSGAKKIIHFQRATSVNIIGDIYHHHRYRMPQPLTPTLSRLAKERDGNSRSPSPEKQTSSSNNNKAALTMFHMIVAVKNTGQDGQRELDELYRLVVRPFTVALGQEQVRCGYVRRQAQKMLSLIDTMTHAMEEVDSLQERMLSECSLAREMVKIFEALHENRLTLIKINEVIPLTIYPLRPPLPPPTSTRLLRQDKASKLHFIRPYHTLLLVEEDAEELISQLPKDGYEKMIKLLQHVTYLQSLEQIAENADLPLADVFQLVMELVDWRKARVVDLVRLSNVYVLNDEAELADLADRIKEFDQNYAPLRFSPLLCVISRPITPGYNNLAQVIAAYRTMLYVSPSAAPDFLFIEAMIYLLKCNLIKQLHLYAFLLLPKRVRDGRADSLDHALALQIEAEAGLAKKSELDCWVLQSGFCLDEKEGKLEQRWTDKLDPTATFKRLHRYFDGECSLDEIEWRERISRFEILKLFQAHQDQLCFFIY